MNNKLKKLFMTKIIKEKGFTLIELLAVILILGIIALIAVPTINDIINDSRREAFKTTLNNIEKKVEETCTLEKLKNLEINTNYKIKNGVSIPALNLKGDLPDGDIYVDSNCNVTYTLANKNYVGTKDDPEGEVVISKNDGSQNSPTLIEKSTDKSKSYVGYYADVDGNGTVDGIIFADLITGRTNDDNRWGDGTGGTNDGYYEIPSSSNPSIYKDYYIGKNYKGDFGTKPILSLAKNSKGEDRFYVLALDDLSNSNYYWYYSAYGNMADHRTYTTGTFGDGHKNTSKMLTKWDSSGYGAQNANSSYKDLWGEIGDYADKGWFVPSKEELSAFGGEITDKHGVTKNNYKTFGLSDGYWSSSQIYNLSAWALYYMYDHMGTSDVNTAKASVRLAITF